MLKMIKTYHFSYIPVGLSVGIGKFWKFIFCYEAVAGLKRKNENRFVKFYHASRFIFLFFDLNCVCFFDEAILVVERENKQ